MSKEVSDQLSNQQQEAVKSDIKRLLVLAGAGSGKTKTLLEKIVYLIREKNISPSQILAITFTKNAANEMIDRLLVSADTSGAYSKILADKYKTWKEKQDARWQYTKEHRWIQSLTIKTFHSFCYRIMRDSGVNVFDNKFKIIGAEKIKEEELPKYSADETIYEVFYKSLMNLCEDKNYLLGLKRFILDYLVDKVHIKRSTTEIKEGKFYTSLNGTKVRSKSEQLIADWFYRHDIDIVYEPDLHIADFAFRPDFYVPAANLYIEHVSNKSFAMRDKEEQFHRGKLLLVKTFEPMTKDTTVIYGALEQMVKGRLSAVPASRHVTFKEEFSTYGEQVKDFLEQVIRVTDMMKVENLALGPIATRGKQDQHDRVRSFYALASPLIESYAAYCTNKSFMDFNDLVSKSIEVLKTQNEICSKYRDQYKYILVDEFQDVNNLQVELLKLLITDETQLFCVGDDWQSIYGFRGSNVDYIIDFEKHFPQSKVLKFNLNYRSSQHIVGASNEVIRNNKYKIEKNIEATRKSTQKITVFSGLDQDENTNYCLETVKNLLKEGMTAEDILFLYRRTDMFKPYQKSFKAHGIRVTSKTIHSAKGLEAKAVFIIGLVDGSGGFPDVWLEDRIFQVVRKGRFDLLMEEERRLFYVAITRAKEKLFLITEQGIESMFLREIPDTYTVKTSDEAQHLVEEPVFCKNCSSRLDNKLFAFCPFCGSKIE